MNTLILSSIPCLESLPDELFYDIFEYLSVRDLYNGFYNLNCRFTSILSSLTNVYGEMITKEEAYSPAFLFFATRITILSVEHVEPIDFSSFVALRSLRLHTEPNRSQCQSIQLLSRLEYLSVDKPRVEHFYYSISLSFFVLTNAFPSLRSCRLNLIPFKDKQQWTLVPSLHILNISIGNPRVYPQILYACPSLDKFSLEFTPHFTTPPKVFFDSSHTSLRQLKLRLNCTTFSYCQIIDLLLSLVPNLIYLSIRGSLSDANNIDIDSLAIILYDRVPKLNKFFLKMAVQESLINTQQDDNYENIQQLHPLFQYIIIDPSTQYTPARLIIQSESG
ncbi:unnamed protein product [Adineta steineri]|uniref:F-box domain-containing protein n=1 Tax=Adineta steineri TaxID=433720 RepID=A0A813WY90_9BILA|nr:unnamed protein product [Adineta steineri]CAF1432338.1 unnamed protein product [Adineta steineri]